MNKVMVTSEKKMNFDLLLKENWSQKKGGGL